MKKALVFEASRDGYGIDQLRNPVTVGELREMLADFPDDMLIICSHDNGYTYGSLSRSVMVQSEHEGEYGTEYIVDEEFYW